jgi:hypothetical protein
LNQSCTKIDFLIGTSPASMVWQTNITANIPGSINLEPVNTYQKLVNSTTKGTNRIGSFNLWANYLNLP